MVFSPGMSAAETMVNSCQGTDGSKVMDEIRPRGIVLRTVAPNHMPGSVMSSTYWARPMTLATPSLRGGDVPTIWVGLVMWVGCKDRPKAARREELNSGSASLSD